MNQLYNYQVEGVKHLLSMPFGRPHALLADAPGTGKTVMAIEAAKQSGCKTGVIVCPASVKEQWKRMALKWDLCAEDQIQVVYGQYAQLDSTPWKIINYDLARLPEIQTQFVSRKWNCLALDEAHRVKTHGSIQTKALIGNRGIGSTCYYKWALSGSIVPNRPVELFPLLASFAPEVMGKHNSWEAYLNRYCGGAFAGGKGASNVQEITDALQPFMLRRTLEDVWRELPPIVENVVYLSDVEYEKHPEWLGLGFMPEATERRIIAEAKIPAIARFVSERIEDGTDKIVVFTYHRQVIDKLMLLLKHLNPAKIYGGISGAARQGQLDKFTNQADCRVIFLQIGSGGEALDGLQHVCAEYVEAEPEWSPGREDQAQARLLRLGQKRTVIATKLLVAGSYEEVIYNASQRKRRVINIITKPNGGVFTMPTLEENIERIANNTDILIKAFYALGQADMRAVNAAVPAPTAPPANLPPMGNLPPLQDPPIQFLAPPAQQFAPPQQFAPSVVPAAPAATQSPLQSATAPIAGAPGTNAVAGDDAAAKQAFENQVLQLFQTKENGFDKMGGLLKQFGISGNPTPDNPQGWGRLGQLPAEHRANFMAYAAQA